MSCQSSPRCRNSKGVWDRGGGRGDEGACLTCRASEEYLRSNTEAISEVFPNASLFLRCGEPQHSRRFFARKVWPRPSVRAVPKSSDA